MGNLIERARQLRATIEELATKLTDDAALEAKELFSMWSTDTDYEVDDRVRYEDGLYRVLQNHTSQDDWTPTNAPALFAEILPGQDGTDIGEWVQPDSTNPYMKGDKVTFNGKTYESTIDGNVWSPADYPAGWKEVE